MKTYWLALMMIFAGVSLRAEPVNLVNDGTIHSETFQAEQWQLVDGALVGQPKQIARCNVVFPGDFSIKSRLSIKEINEFIITERQHKARANTFESSASMSPSSGNLSSL